MRKEEQVKILTIGDETLKKHSSLVTVIDKGVVDFIHALSDTMYEGKGIGLAAAQVGELKRIFVCHVNGDKLRVFINPEIIETSYEQVSIEEGCLSIPGLYTDVVRPVHIRIQAWNEQEKPFTLEADGILARVIQHEFDHLNGVLFVDKVNPKKRERLLKTYNQKVKM